MSSLCNKSQSNAELRPLLLLFGVACFGSIFLPSRLCEETLRTRSTESGDEKVMKPKPRLLCNEEDTFMLCGNLGRGLWCKVSHGLHNLLYSHLCTFYHEFKPKYKWLLKLLYGRLFITFSTCKEQNIVT